MNEGRWPSEMLIVMFPLIVSGLKVFVKILSMSVLELLFSFVGSDMEGRGWSTEVRRRNLNFFYRRRMTLNITSPNNIVNLF